VAQVGPLSHATLRNQKPFLNPPGPECSAPGGFRWALPPAEGGLSNPLLVAGNAMGWAPS